MKRVVLSITGASGAGKSTLENGLTQFYCGGRVRTITTRSRRENESEDAYHFVSEKKLDEMDQQGLLLWRIKTHGNQYAVTRRSFYRALHCGSKVAFVCITPKQHAWVEDAFRYNADLIVIKIHLDIPPVHELERRLCERGDDVASISRRIADSQTFEKAASSIPGLNRIRPCSRECTLQQCIEIIETVRK